MAEKQLIFRKEIRNLLVNEPITVPLGLDNARSDYKIKITGYPSVVGSGFMRFIIRAGGSFKSSVEDSILIVG